MPSLLPPLALAAVLGACAPAFRAGAQTAPPQAAPARPTASEGRQQGQRYLGVWALVDNDNNLFNVRLRPDGRATSTAGIQGTPLAGSGALQLGQLREQGRWRPWGNGGPGAMACASTTPTAGLMRC